MRVQAWLGALLFLSACGSDASIGNDGTGGNGGAGGGTCTSLVPCCDDATGDEVDPLCDDNLQPYCASGSSWPDDSGVCKASASEVCLDPGDCNDDSYCDFADDFCGEGGPGLCRQRPQACNDIYAPFCVCGDFVADNACEGYASGFDISVFGSCTAPPDTFRCGSMFCVVNAQYCLAMLSDVGAPNYYACEPIPQMCTDPTCECLLNEVNLTCSEFCNDEGGALTLSCAGG